MTQQKILNSIRSALIIDDENDICFLLSNILKKNDLKVSCVNSLAEGIASLKLHEPCVLFLDNYVKNEHAGTKIIMVTAHDTPDDRKNALQRGANFFIAKPFTVDQIKNALQNI